MCYRESSFWGQKRKSSKKFMNKSIELGEYIAFILPIRQLNNVMTLYKFNLIHSEDLGLKDYSGIPIRCCFNIYKKPKNGLNKSKPQYELNDIKIYEHHRTKNPMLEHYDYRICSFGSSIGKECNANTYCKELCFEILKHKEQVLYILSNTDFKKVFPSISTPYVSKWQVYKYIKEQIPEIE